MIKIDGVEFRNLEEQVQKNKEDIAAHYNIDRVLAEFGIRIIGQVTSVNDLPNPDDFSGSYGDAYAVGTSAPYTFYIWTRADPNAGHTNDYWFNVGQLSILGPQGPQGIQGPQGETGERGSLWFSGNGIPSNAQNYNVGDQYLDAQNGDVYSLIIESGSKIWMLQRNIIGPQGIQGIIGPQGLQGVPGPKGETGARGPAGPLVNIIGTLGNIDQLPDPETLQRQSGYIIPIDGVYHVFIIIGETNSLQWFDAGLFGAGTIITENGNVLTEWDATNVLKYPLASEGSPIALPGYVFQRGDGYRIIPPSTFFQESFSVENNILVPFVNGTLQVATVAAINNIKGKRSSEIPSTGSPISGSSNLLREGAATPRCYVDDQIRFAKQDLGKTELRCNIINRTLKTFVLQPNKFYVIHGYGTNKVNIRKKDGTVLIEGKNDILCMVSSSGVDGSTNAEKTWHGFISIASGTLGVPSINWTGDLLDVGVYAENISPESDGGSGFMYVYELGAFPLT